GEHALLDERTTDGDCVVMIDVEDSRGRPTDRSPPNQRRTVPLKVQSPSIFARMVKTSDPPRRGIDPGDVRPLEAVAVKAGERQMGSVGGAAVLPGDDVIDLEGDGRQTLRKPAVLAGTVCPPPDERRESLLHQRSRLDAGPLQRTPRLGAHELEQTANAP